MAQVTFKGSPVHTQGDLPQKDKKAPDFQLVNGELAEVNLAHFKGENLVLNIFPSVDTGVCATSVRKFHEIASKLKNTKVLCISKDLPFAQGRFCAAEGIDNVIMLSDFRGGFEKNYPIAFTDGPLKGLLSRCVVIINPEGEIIYTEQVSEVTEEPNYEKVFELLK